MKITANIKLPQKVTAEMKKILVPVTGSFDEGYSAGYDKGHADGHEEGYTEGEAAGLAEGIEQGRQAERTEFWDSGTVSGTLENWEYAFAGKFWNDNTFKLPYKIKPTSSNARYMFYKSGIKNGRLITDKVDFSGVSACVQIFYNSSAEEFGVIDFSSVASGWGGLNQTFYDCAARKIEKLILPKTSVPLQNGFSSCKYLTDIAFEGTAYQNVNFQWSPLNKPSIISVFSCLDNTVTGQTATFNKAAVNKAFETSEGAADGSTSEEWLTLAASKPNWTVSLV